MGPWRDVVSVSRRMHHGTSCDRLGVGHHALQRTARRAQLVGSRPRTGVFRPRARLSPHAASQRGRRRLPRGLCARSEERGNPRLMVECRSAPAAHERLQEAGRAGLCAQSENPRVLRTVAALLFNFGEQDKAFEFYSKAIEVDPTEGFALYYRAREYRFKRKFAEAIADASALLAVSQAGLNDARSFLDASGSFAISAPLRCLSAPIATRIPVGSISPKRIQRGGRCRAFGACARRTGAFSRLLRPAQGRCAARPHRGGA